MRIFLIAYLTLVRKECHRFLRIWPQTLLPPVITTTLYFLIFGEVIGRRIGPMAGVAYLDYIVPGVILMAVINSAYANTVSSFFSAKFQRYIEEMLVAPMPSWVILAGYLTGGMARALITGGLVMAVALLFTDLRPQDPFWSGGIALLTALLFATAGLINAVFAKTFDDISIIPNFVLTPLVYLGGVFYSIELLPPFWQELSLYNPMLYLIGAFRFGFLGISDVEPTVALEMMGGLLAALILAAWLLLHFGIGLKQ